MGEKFEVPDGSVVVTRRKAPSADDYEAAARRVLAGELTLEQAEEELLLREVMATETPDEEQARLLS